MTGHSIDFKSSDADIGKRGYAIAPRIIDKHRHKLRSSILLVPDEDLDAEKNDALSAAGAPSVVSPYQEENASMRKLIDTKKRNVIYMGVLSGIWILKETLITQ